MKRPLPLLLGLLVSAVVAPDAAAQWNVARFDAGRDRVYATFGLDPAFVTTVGYARMVPLFGHGFQFAGDVALANTGWDLSDFRARLQAQTSIVRWRSLQLTGSATFITRGTENSIYRAINFGSDFTATGGVYRSGWFAAGEFGFDKAIITHITHSDWYRRYYYPDAKDGWYLNAGGTFHYGVVGGVTIGRVELVGRLGMRRTESFKEVTPPLYGGLGIGVGF